MAGELKAFLQRPDLNVGYTYHARRRMVERRVEEESVRKAMDQAQIIEGRFGDGEHALLLCQVAGRPMHLAVKLFVNLSEVVIKTVYEPDPQEWEPGFKRRRQA